MLEDENIVMKNEIKKLAAVAFSALGILAFSSGTFCQCSSTECSDPVQGSSEKGEGTIKNDELSLYISYPGEEYPVNEFYGSIKELAYPIGTFDVKRFYKIIELNKINNSWDCYMSDNKANPIYGFCLVFIKNGKAVYFYFDPMEMPEKFVGPNWYEEGFSIETLLNNFKKFVLSFGFEERKCPIKNIKDFTLFEVPDEMICLNDKTFENFSNLEKIIIPSTVRKISKDTFKCCKNLKVIKYMGTNYTSVQEFIKNFNYFNKVFEELDKKPLSSYGIEF